MYCSTLMGKIQEGVMDGEKVEDKVCVAFVHKTECGNMYSLAMTSEFEKQNSLMKFKFHVNNCLILTCVQLCVPLQGVQIMVMITMVRL